MSVPKIVALAALMVLVIHMTNGLGARVYHTVNMPQEAQP